MVRVYIVAVRDISIWNTTRAKSIKMVKNSKISWVNYSLIHPTPRPTRSQPSHTHTHAHTRHSMLLGSRQAGILYLLVTTLTTLTTLLGAGDALLEHLKCLLHVAHLKAYRGADVTLQLLHLLYVLAQVLILVLNLGHGLEQLHNLHFIHLLHGRLVQAALDSVQFVCHCVQL